MCGGRPALSGASGGGASEEADQGVAGAPPRARRVERVGGTSGGVMPRPGRRRAEGPAARVSAGRSWPVSSSCPSSSSRGPSCVTRAPPRAPLTVGLQLREHPSADHLRVRVRHAAILRHRHGHFHCDGCLHCDGYFHCKALAAVLFQGGLRRADAAALEWRDVAPATTAGAILVTVRRSKTDQEGTAADVRYLKSGAAAAVLALRPADPAPTARVFGGRTPQQLGRRFTAAAAAAGLHGRLTAHSGRVGLASELTARGASTTDVMLAGAWKTARMVAHYSAGATAELGAVARYL